MTRGGQKGDQDGKEEGDTVCPWDETTCSYAAQGGYLKILKWARENGCPWDEETTRLAKLYGRTRVLEWARANGCPEKKEENGRN